MGRIETIIHQVPRYGSGISPPNDLDAEGELLGHLLNHPDDMAVVRGLVSPADFWSLPHVIIATAMWDLDLASSSSGGEPFTALAVKDWLKARDLIGRAYGDERNYLYTLATGQPSVASRVGAVALHIRDKARARNIIRTLQTLSAEGYGNIGKVSAWAERVAGEVAKVAMASSDVGASGMGQVAGEAMRRLDAMGAGMSGWSTGLAELDHLTAGLHRRELTLVAAPFGGGKTALAGQIALEVAMAGVGALVFSLEMPADHFALRFACWHALVDSGELRAGNLGAKGMDELRAALVWLSTLPLKIDDRGERQPMSVDAIRAEVMRTKLEMSRKGLELGVVVVDLIQLVDWRAHVVGRNGSKYDGLDEIGLRLRELAREADVAILATAHLNKEGKIRDCPALAGHAHNHWDIKLDGDGAYAGPRGASIRIRKQRHGKPSGNAAVWYHGPHYRFSDSERLTQ
jgi:replicative DNA helicase